MTTLSQFDGIQPVVSRQTIYTEHRVLMWLTVDFRNFANAPKNQ